MAPAGPTPAPPRGPRRTPVAELDKAWLRPDSRARQRLDGAGVHRLILLVPPPFDTDEIRQAGQLLIMRSSPA